MALVNTLPGGAGWLISDRAGLYQVRVEPSVRRGGHCSVSITVEVAGESVTHVLPDVHQITTWDYLLASPNGKQANQLVHVDNIKGKMCLCMPVDDPVIILPWVLGKQVLQCIIYTVDEWWGPS